MGEERSTLSVAIIAYNEEQNIGRTVDSVSWAEEIFVIDSGSIDRTVDVAREAGASVVAQAWLGFAAQKNFAIAQCRCDWVLSLDADEVVSDELAREIQAVLQAPSPVCGYLLPRRNYFLGRAMLHGGFYPDAKLRLVRREYARFADRAVHESLQAVRPLAQFKGDLLHKAYPDLAGYVEHMNRYSTLAAATLEPAAGLPLFVWNTVVNPVATFVYNYVFRLGFLDGRRGLLLHLYHSCYVSWKYAKAWERGERGH